METPAQKNAPLADCFLATPGNKPAYGLSATFGPYAKSFREGGSANPELRLASGAAADHDYRWATARCPGSPERALFALWKVHERTAVAKPVVKGAPAFEAAALTAFAEDAVRQHGCTDLRLPRTG